MLSLSNPTPKKGWAYLTGGEPWDVVRQEKREGTLGYSMDGKEAENLAEGKG